MSTNVNTLSYLGIKEPNPPNIFFRDRTPLTSDYKIYDLLDLWEDTTTLNVYILVSKAAGIAVWVLLTGGGVGTLNTLTGDDALPVLPVANNINVQGGRAGSISFTTSGAGQLNAQVLVDGTTIQIIGNQLVAVNSLLPWIETAVGLIMSANTGYIANSAILINLILPAIAPQGTVIRVTGKGAGLYLASANAGQIIYFGSQTTIVAGNLAATQTRDTVEFVCITANTEWNVLSSIGNFIVT